MRIAIDLRPLQIGHQNRGIGVYLLNLLNETPRNDDDIYIFLRYSNSNPIEEYGLGEGRQYKEVLYKKHSFSKHPVELFVYVWTSLLPNFSKVNRHRPDVFLQCDYLLGAPRGHCRVITVSYDLIPLKFRYLYLPPWKKYIGYRNLRLRSRARLVFHALFYDRKYKNGIRLLKRSDKIISISKNTTKDLVSMLNINEGKIKTIYLAASFRHGERDNIVRGEVKKLVDTIDVPYIVYIGATDRRRQIAELVHALNLYNAFQAPLSMFLCGKEFRLESKSLDAKAKAAIEKSSYKHNIHLLGRITEAEKNYILQKAKAFVYPS
ncbi:MAG: glycosyltransferase, partial [Minisyncoccia bacterium]